MNSWIKLSRKILNWEWYHNDSCKALLLHLLLRVNWQEKEFGNITTVKPGELVTSQAHLAMELGKSRQEIRTALKKLKDSGTITLIAAKNYTHIKLNKYFISEDSVLEKPQPNNPQETIKKPCSNQALTTTKEYNKEIRKEGNKYSNDNSRTDKKYKNVYGIVL